LKHNRFRFQEKKTFFLYLQSALDQDPFSNLSAANHHENFKISWTGIHVHVLFLQNEFLQRCTFRSKVCNSKSSFIMQIWSQYFQCLKINYFKEGNSWSNMLSINNRRERPLSSLPPSHQNHNFWKSWLLKVINFLLRTLGNNSDLYL
jgi:hypothetical protein